MTDDERLAKVIVDSLQQVDKYFGDDELETETAFRALDRADAAAEKLGERPL